MIVHNEAAHLPASLESARSLADEIIVVDTGSTDGSADVARKLGAIVVEHAWSDDFSAARNAGWRAAHGDWLLWLDAGERLDADTVGGLRDFIDCSADGNVVYSIMVELPAPDASVSNEQIAQPRLMPNRPDLRFVGRVRETIIPGATALGMKIQVAPGRIVRDARDHNAAHRAVRARRNLGLAMKEGAQTGSTPPRLLLVAGEAHAELGAIDRACESFRAAVEKAAAGSTELLEAYYGWLAALNRDADRVEEQLQVCLRALDAFPLDAQLLLTMGSLMQKHDRLDLAVRSFDAAVKHAHVDLATWHLTELPEVAVSCLAAALQLTDDEPQAQRVLEEAIAQGESPRLLGHLLDLFIKQGRTQAALDTADRLPVSDAEIGALQEAVQGACLASAGDWTAALGHLQIAHLQGCRHPLALRWLAVTYLANGQVDMARPVLAEWQKVEASSPELQKYLLLVDETAITEPSPGAWNGGRTIRVDRPEDARYGIPAVAASAMQHVD
jgi:tetratricopeptide (TPR) repeat protein